MLEQRHPAVWLGYFLAVLAVTMFLWHPVLLTLSLVGGVAFWALLRRDGPAQKGTGWMVLFLCVVVLTNPLFVRQGDTVLFTLWRLPVTLEALLYGVAMGVSLGAVLVWCRCMMAMLPGDRLLQVFGGAAPRTTLVLSMALRFVPLLLRQLRRTRRAQQAMGLTAAGTPMERLRLTGRTLTATLSWALENAMDTAASMRARGYAAGGRRTAFAPVRFSRRDGVWLAVVLGLLAVTLWGAGGLGYAYFPRLTVLPPAPLGWAAYAAYGLLTLLPCLTQGWEGLRWVCCKPKN